jgi:hypothetical protein
LEVFSGPGSMPPKKKQESGEQTLTRIAIVSGDRLADG